MYLHRDDLNFVDKKLIPICFIKRRVPTSCNQVAFVRNADLEMYMTLLFLVK